MIKLVACNACCDLVVPTASRQAIEIFCAKAHRTVRGSLAASLAARFDITQKAVRDIWNLRTWTWTTKPFWTQTDHALFLTTHRLCDQCQSRDVRSLNDACEACASPPRRGRPRIEDTQLLDAAAGVPPPVQVEEDQSQAEALAGATLPPGHSQTAIDECIGVRPDPNVVCAAVHDMLAETAFEPFVHTSEAAGSSQGYCIREPPFFPMLDDGKDLARDETPARMFSDSFSHEENASLNAFACGDSDVFMCMKIDDTEEDAHCGTVFQTGTEMLCRQEVADWTVLLSDDGDGV